MDYTKELLNALIDEQRRTNRLLESIQRTTLQLAFNTVDDEDQMGLPVDLKDVKVNKDKPVSAAYVCPECKKPINADTDKPISRSNMFYHGACVAKLPPIG